MAKIVMVGKRQVGMEIFDQIAISSRIRLARNVSGVPFYTKNNDLEAARVTKQVKEVLDKFDIFNFLTLKNRSLNECNALFEQHLISRELIANKDISSVAISEDGKVIVMLHEEDHIREQCLEPGFNLLKPFRRLTQIDDAIIEQLPICFDEQYGFITASPANLGTGMRASVMLFLPALERAGKCQNFISEAKEKGLTVRGIYGEGSSAVGSFYQISNQASFGLSESDIIDKVSAYVYEICNEESQMREYYMLEERASLQDEALRAYGILTNCYAIAEGEMTKLLSRIKFGAALGFMDILDEEKFQKLYDEGGSANLKEIFEFSDIKKENLKRAEYISNKVKSLVVRR